MAPSSAMDPIAQTLMIVAALLILGAVGEFIFARTRVPDVIWLVLAGVLAGPVFGIVSPALLQPGIPVFGAIALTVILSGGAFRLRLSEVSAAAPRGIGLGLAGYALSMVAVCAFLWLATLAGYVKPASPWLWLMVGAIVGGTSSDIIMPTMDKGQAPPAMARMLEVESAATDAICVVLAVALMQLIANGSTDFSQPLIALARELGFGVLAGVIAAALMVPFIPPLRDKTHGYTLFLATMLALYAMTEHVGGNGAMAVLTASLLMGNASSLVPKLFPGAHGEPFTASRTAAIMQDQMTFLIKSFFFFLIGLMFPTDPRLITLGAAAAFFLLLFRFPAVALATRGLGLAKAERVLLNVSIPRGLAAGVLATLPFHYGIPGMENLAPVLFAVIVFSILVFSLGFWAVSHMPIGAAAPPAGVEPSPPA
jgi:cell volume regulation protein A